LNCKKKEEQTTNQVGPWAGVRVHPVYQWLRAKTDNNDIAWNFETKFIISRDGATVKRYSNAYNVNSLKAAIKSLVGAKPKDGL